VKNKLFWYRHQDGRTTLVRCTRVEGNTAIAISASFYGEEYRWTIGDPFVLEIQPPTPGRESLLEESQLADLLDLFVAALSDPSPPPPAAHPSVELLEVFAIQPDWAETKKSLWRLLTPYQKRKIKAQTRDCSFDIPPLS
jgi:hypothetical protein